MNYRKSEFVKQTIHGERLATPLSLRVPKCTITQPITKKAGPAGLGDGAPDQEAGWRWAQDQVFLQLQRRGYPSLSPLLRV